MAETKVLRVFQTALENGTDTPTPAVGIEIAVEGKKPKMVMIIEGEDIDFDEDSNQRPTLRCSTPSADVIEKETQIT